MKVFVTGGTGLIGSRLVRRLRERGDSVVLLTRRPAAARERLPEECTFIEGDSMHAGSWMDAIGECDGVINLVGENIFAHRWNDDFKVLLHDSRVKSTEHVVQALVRNPRTAAGRPKVLVNASAIGYYGPRGDEEITEESPPGDDTLARLCVDWENAARRAEPSGVRVTRVRIGVVFDKEGGPLAMMLPPFKMGVGGPVGSGRQWLSWIHHHDVISILILGLDDEQVSGPINATAPNPVSNKGFAKALGRALHRPSFLPVPKLALKLRFGQVAEVLTTGQRVLPKQALAAGYLFVFPSLDGALANLLG
jgi:uncharacterized protein (TIGR01777 family)